MFEGHGRLCSIRLSAPLLKLRPRSDLVNTLLVRAAVHLQLVVSSVMLTATHTYNCVPACVLVCLHVCSCGVVSMR